MNENTLQLIAIGKLFWVVIFVGCYGFGGISDKWIRRYLGAFWMGLGVFVFGSLQDSFHWWHLLYAGLLCGALHLGYGGDSNAVKIRKRSTYGIALGVSALPLVFGSGLWVLYIYHCILCVSVSVLLGVWNPTKNARSEETLIAFLSTVIPLYLI